MNEINYDEKICNFQAITENYDNEIAMNYLTRHNWDETKASQTYFNEMNNSRRNLNSNIINTPGHYTDDIHEQDAMTEAKENLLKPNSIKQTHSINVQAQNQRSQNVSYWQSFKNFLSHFIFCTKNNDNDSSQGVVFLNGLPGKIDQYNIFINNISSKVGILVLYRLNELNFLEQFFEKIRKTDYLLDILRENYVLYAIDADSPDGRRVLSLVTDPLLTPSFLFVFNQNQRNFNQASIMNRLEGRVSEHDFQEALIHNIESAQAKKNHISSTPLDEDNSHAAMIKMQQEELRKLEEMERDKKRKELEEERRQRQEKEEQLRKEKEKEEQRKMILKSLPLEPEESNKDATKIVFRYPDLNRRIERRFLKSETVQILYNYVDSLGKDIFAESDSYELVQTFPYKAYTNKEKTLLEEGLFPNAIIQIKEV